MERPGEYLRRVAVGAARRDLGRMLEEEAAQAA
jgi:hypothetical protein